MKIEIIGNPIAQTRARIFKNRFYDPQYKVKKNFRDAVLDQLTKIDYDFSHIHEPVKLKLDFIFSMPKSWSKKKREKKNQMPHTNQIDIDNLQKFFFDTCNELLWLDDRQIWNVHATKTWGEEGKTILEIIETEENQ